MTQCQICGGRATDAFICKDHQTELAAMLADLPGWLRCLAEAAVGQAKLGDGGRRTRTEPDGLGKYADPALAADGSGGTEGQRRLERDLADPKLPWRLLAAGGVNASASTLFDTAQNTLGTWVRDLYESRGVELPPSLVQSDRTNYTGVVLCVRMAQVLRSQIRAISASEGAGQCYGDIKNLIERIERVVDRPISWKWLGPCPSWLEDKRQTCGKELRARADAIEVRCPGCRQTHNCNRLQLLLINDLERSKVTIARILELNRVLPEEYRIPERTLRHWRQHEKLKPKGWMRPDGSHGINRRSDEDEPLYAWSDVRKLRAEQWKVKTG